MSYMKHVLPLLVLLMFHAVFLQYHAYAIPHLDSVMHFSGGIVLGIFILGALSCCVKYGWLSFPGRFLMLVLTFSLVTTGAVFWEFLEWLIDATMDTSMQVSISDTMKDLLLGQLGALVYIFWSMSSIDSRYPVVDTPQRIQPVPTRR